MITEEWKPVSCVDGVYSVSNLGNVKRNTKRTNSVIGKNLKAWTTTGYPMVTLWVEGVPKKITCHVLVATEFCYRPVGTNEVNHRNGIKCDNRAENLEWVTHKENSQHAWETALNPRTLNRSDVLEIQRLRTALPLKGMKSIARQFGVTHKTIHNIWRDDSYAERCPK